MPFTIVLGEKLSNIEDRPNMLSQLTSCIIPQQTKIVPVQFVQPLLSGLLPALLDRPLQGEAGGQQGAGQQEEESPLYAQVHTPTDQPPMLCSWLSFLLWLLQFCTF